MANVKISALPQYTAATNDDIWFVNNNSGETETTKIQLNDFNGLIKGQAGNNSIRSNPYLTSVVASATSNNAIAIGNAAEATSEDSIAIGNHAYNVNNDGGRPGYIAIGKDAQSVQYGIAIGYEAFAGGAETINLGRNARNDGNAGISIGKNANAQGNPLRSILIGEDAFGQSSPQHSIALGYNTLIGANYTIAIGADVENSITYGVAIGGSGQTLNTGAGNSSINSYDGDIISSGQYNGQLNSYNSVISGSTSGATMIGTQSRTADDDDTTYVENLRTFGQYYSNGSLNTGSTITLDMNTGNIHHIEVNGNLSLTLDNVKNGGRYCIITTTTGNYTITSKTATGFTFKVDAGFDALGNVKTHKLVLDVIGNVIYGTSTADLT